MAEEDEIHILGEFGLDIFPPRDDSIIYNNTTLVSQNTDLLNCDYTIHPQWLLDKPSANLDCWYDSNSVISTELPGKLNVTENVGHVFTENCITDESGWTEKEKNLLKRGIEIFGKSTVRLSQFVGSKTPAEVKYYFKNFYVDTQVTQNIFNNNAVEEVASVNDLDVLVDTQIPASIEEVIAAVCTAKSTIHITNNNNSPNSNKKLRKKSTSFNNDENDFVNLKELTYKYSPVKLNYYKLNTESPKLNRSPLKHKLEHVESKPKHKKKKPKINKQKSTNYIKPRKLQLLNRHKPTKFVCRAEITTGEGLSVPVCEGEQIIRIEKENSDKDSDREIVIDVENSDESVSESKTVLPNLINTISDLKKEPEIIPIIDNSVSITNKPTKQSIDLTILDENLVNQLMSLEKPVNEVVINESEIKELEKVIHSEFFEGRPTKTPLRYLKIRNHIWNTWMNMKPSYVTKTSIRNGLKNCGDVNCISRVHTYLEQIGAINFGCQQTNYVRPLYDVFQTNKEKRIIKDVKNYSRNNRNDSYSRLRLKRKYNKDDEGGYTITHGEKGEVLHTTIVHEEPNKQTTYLKRPPIRLIYCRAFPRTSPNYIVKLHLSTLLLMDFHAHTSLMEVMGLIGGEWISSKNTLIISHYEPCSNIKSSATHCDMCPISQAKAADTIHGKDLNILGWFHSHPTFAPEPSQQDLDTQKMFQLWIGNNNPCLGFILSPFSSNGALIASPYRCMVVEKKENFDDQYVPYKFHVEVITDDFDVNCLLKSISNFDLDSFVSKERRIDFSQSYFLDTSINYLEKYITSVRMHLAMCGSVHKSTCDYIVKSIINIFRPKKLKY